MDSSGNLYGTTTSGGAGNEGTVFELTPNAAKTVWTHKVLSSLCPQRALNCAEGVKPLAGLIMDASENLYGTTVAGGQQGWGTVFELKP
jgi:uncharacterized repeat protein (TIGR03803 family)